MLSGILSDTVMLKSPTATGAEKKAIQELSSIAGLDWEAWGREMFEHAATLKGSEARQIVNGDFKTYEHRGVHIGIGQVEVVAFEEIPEVKKELVEVMESESTRRGLDWVLLLITNVLKEESILLCSEAPRFSEKLLYKKRARGEYELPGILSRKKQLLPEILGLLEEA